MTYWLVGSSMKELARGFVKLMLSPRVWLAYLIGGAGVGGGTVATTPAARMRMFYQLTIEGKPYGSWIATIAGTSIQSWGFVKPHQALPERDDFIER
jgi:hypothetical protein